MAIESFDLSRALGSQSYAFKCWENYYYGNNTMGIDAKSMGEIKQTYKSELANWQANALNDENAYEIPDDDFSKSYEDGKNTAKEDTGFDGKKGGMIARGTGDAAWAAGTGIVASGALNGVTDGVAQGMGRAIGETMAVNYVIGNQALMPFDIFMGGRTLTTNIVLEMGYATDLHREALIACGVVLFVFILLINLCFSALKRRAE